MGQSVYFPPQQLNYSKLLKVCRDYPRARELRLCERDFHAIAYKDSPFDPRIVRPDDAPADWTPPDPGRPTIFQIVTEHAGVRVIPDWTCVPGEVAIYP